MSTLAIIVTIVGIAWALIVLLQPGPKYHLTETPDGVAAELVRRALYVPPK